MKAILKLIDFKPRVSSDGVISVLLYELSESWREAEVDNNIDSLIALAGNTLSTNPPEANSYRFVEVEAPGSKVVIGEGGVEGVETVLIPVPGYLRSIKFIKVSGENPVVVHEFKPDSTSIVYDSTLSFNKQLDYDLILVETSELSRIIFPHELLLERVRVGEKKARKKRRKRSKKVKTRARRRKTGRKKRSRR
ncbi:hypothetical protein ACSU1N_00275 [Thermogladius sp. 4427co]|uniref:hypothetical protein n=1 Tax=Thermogladius sp. 4427co TaxID=3450718 RepID=UPI003F793B53